MLLVARDPEFLQLCYISLNQESMVLLLFVTEGERLLQL